MSLIQTLIVDLLVLGSFWGLGILIIRAIVPSSSRFERFALGYPLGSGIYSFLLFILGWMGVAINQISTIIVFCFLFLIALVSGDQRSRIRSLRRQTAVDVGLNMSASRREKATWVILWTLIFIGFFISVGRSYSAYDAAAEWAVEGYGISHDGTIFAGLEWGMWGISYPLNTKLQVATFMFFGQEVLPGSKLIYPAYLVSLVLGCYHFLVKHHVNKIFAGLITLFLLTNPVMFIHGTNGYVNVAFTAALILGVLQLISGIMDKKNNRQFLGGLLLAVAVWTRPEGIVFAVTIALAFLIFSRLAGQKFETSRIFIPIMISAIWMLFAWGGVREGQLGNAIKSMLIGITNGDYNLFELYLIPRLFVERAIDPDNWGAFIPVVGLLVIAAWITRAWRKELLYQFMLIVIIVFCAIPMGIYYAVSFEPFNDQFVNVLRRDFDRSFLPAFTAMTMYASILWAEQAPKIVEEDLEIE